jgi:AraC-like DNA-binding protein
VDRRRRDDHHVPLAEGRYSLSTVARWRASCPAPGRYAFQTAPGFGHALSSPIVANTLAVMRISGTVWDGVNWWSIHTQPGLRLFEIEHGKGEDRLAYNNRALARVTKQRKTVRGEHGGYYDLFVPIVVDRTVEAVLVVGRFAVERPTAPDILLRWRRLTGRQAHPADPEFAAFLSATLAVLVLEGRRAAQFQRLLECLAKLMAGTGDAGKLATQADALRVELEEARAVDRTWEAVATMLDERSTRIWSSAHRAFELGRLGLLRMADHVLVALSVSEKQGDDPVEEAVRRDSLQRHAVALAASTGHAIAGRVGDNGVVFLSAAPGSAERKRRKLSTLAEQTARLARQFGLQLHFGMAAAIGSVPLSRSYQVALGAAESALTQGARLVVADSSAPLRARSLRALRQELVKTVQEHPAMLSPRFERYLQQVAVHSGYQVEPARAHLEVGFEQMSAALMRRGDLDDKSYIALCDGLERAAAEARSMSELFAAYHRAVADAALAMQRPVPARRERHLRHALEYVHQHYAEPLRLHKVARLAGYAPNHFSALFLKQERVGFAAYVSGVRLEHAQRLLRDTTLSVTRIAELCGFNSVEYFCRAFRLAKHISPQRYRERARSQRTPRKSTATNVEKYRPRASRVR